MAGRQSNQDESLRRFYRRVWKQDVVPLLRGRRKKEREKAARVSGKIAATAGLFVDRLLGLKGRPFARSMTVMGSSLGAMLPDVWDWKWLRHADESQRKVVDEQVRRRVAELPVAEALDLFGLSPTATRDELKQAWRAASLKHHPDKTTDESRQTEFHLRFVTYRSAYECLCKAYDDGRLPEPCSSEKEKGSG